MEWDFVFHGGKEELHVTVQLGDSGADVTVQSGDSGTDVTVHPGDSSADMAAHWGDPGADVAVHPGDPGADVNYALQSVRKKVRSHCPLTHQVSAQRWQGPDHSYTNGNPLYPVDA